MSVLQTHVLIYSSYSRVRIINKKSHLLKAVTGPALPQLGHQMLATSTVLQTVLRDEYLWMLQLGLIPTLSTLVLFHSPKHV